jgi:hypothetical protein
MKKIFLLLFFILHSSLFILSAQDTPQGARFKFDKTTHDFGTIDHSLPKVECRFEFSNDGSEPLVITNARTSCSCTKVSYDKKPIPPGGRGTIKVIYEVSKKDAGVFYKTIDIYSNSVDKRISLIIKGNAQEK